MVIVLYLICTISLDVRIFLILCPQTELMDGDITYSSMRHLRYRKGPAK